MNINVWANLAGYYGSYFGLTEKKIKGFRTVDNIHELYFIDSDDEEEMLYMESQEFQSFYTFFTAYGWNNVFVTKYLSPFNKVPAFILHAESKDYRLQYHFYIEKDIVADAYMEYKGIGYIPFEDMGNELKIQMKKIHIFLEGYVFAKYGAKMESEPRLQQFIDKIVLD